MDPTISLEPASILAEAKQTAGLDDFGADLAFMEPMEVLLKALDTEAHLNEIGRFSQRQRTVDILVNRLRTQDFIRRHPEILDEKIVAPLVIVGLPRTGTTMLQRFIASDPRMNTTYWYECRNPAPFPGAILGEKDPRITNAEEQVKLMLEGSPELASIHPLDPMAPDEEILLQEMAFVSNVPESSAHVPSYTQWLDDNGYQIGYDYLKVLLQFLQWQKRKVGTVGSSWILKTPAHMASLECLFDVFPDAKVIQTHRDPKQTIPSIASMYYYLWKLASDQVDAKTVGDVCLKTYGGNLAKTMAYRQQFPDRFVDVWYQDTTTDPLAEVEKIYASAGLEMTDDARASMLHWKDENRREDRAPHAYTLQQFGYSDTLIEREFADYRAQFIQ